MKLRVTPETALSFTKMSVAVMGCWPPSFEATTLELTLRDIYWWISFIMDSSMLLALVNGAYEYRQNRIIMIQTLCIATGMLQICLKLIVLKAQRSRFQVIITEMENFVKHSDKREREILQQYVDKCALFHFSITISMYVACFVFDCGPLVLPQPFPTLAAYPFNVESYVVHVMVYFHQMFGNLHSASGAIIECQMAVLLWFAAARFEMLANELTNAVEYRLNVCIQKHLYLLRYTNDVIMAVRFVILATIGITAAAAVLGGIQLISSDTLALRIQYTFVVACAGVELFICSLPADHLMNMSSSVGFAAYSSPWFGKSAKTMRKLFIILQRSQQPATITISGMLPTLSLRYYASFLSSSFSYFMTLRAVTTSSV